MGDFFGFLGPNGAGKTTMINAITGLASFQEGTISVFGHDVVRDYKKTRKLIGLSQQDYNFDNFFNVEQILRYQAGFFGLKGEELEVRVKKTLRQFGLIDKKKEEIINLSGGMKRRLMIAKAFVTNPQILILDEPTAGVDVELRHELWDFLREVNNQGVTVLLTTHYIEEAEKLCNRIGIISSGKIVALDTTKNLKKKYSQDYIEIETTLPARLSMIPGELSQFKPKIVGSTVRFCCENCAYEIENILKGLEKNNIEISKIRVNEDTLESIYLELTRQNESLEGES